MDSKVTTATYIAHLGQQARASASSISKASRANKDFALLAIAKEIAENREALKQHNAKDLAKAQANGLTPAMIDRLTLSDKTIDGMIDGLEQVAKLPDPIGSVRQVENRPSGIELGKMRVPLGVIGIIYESRPNVTIEAAALCLKSGNACILRGGSEAINANHFLAKLIQQGLEKTNIDSAAVQIVDRTDREVVGGMIKANEWIDVIIPRGGKGLIARISAEATIPVIKHLDGNCHVYVDDLADFSKATQICVNAKTHRYGVCNAMESLLIHKDIAASYWPELAQAFSEHQVEIRGCETMQAIDNNILPATESDWGEEYLAPVLSVKAVENMAAAIKHINDYGSGHTDAIVTQDYSRARDFQRQVDSSSVMVNASTRFADGFEYGLGAEIGISTDKLHARGPVGLEGLTSEKFVVWGDGHIRA